MRKAIVTGSSGFIGYHISKRLLEDGFKVIGIDSMTDYYDISLKERRQILLLEYTHFKAINEKVECDNFLMKLFSIEKPDVVIHLAAQAGVRYSIKNPRSYLEGNIIGSFELLEAARAYPPGHMLIASTSSAYGANTEMPYKETDKADHQVSFYAATKKATENMAHSYSHLYNLPITMFRFFTVYGPWGRPDMAPHIFTKAILNGDPIDVYNYGDMKRDFTYIDDLIESMRLLIDKIPTYPLDKNLIDGDSLSPVAPWRVVNIGNSNPIKLTDFIDSIERATGVPASRNLLKIQPGDVTATWADCSLLQSLIGYIPEIDIDEGVKAFVDWYKVYYLDKIDS